MLSNCSPSWILTLLSNDNLIAVQQQPVTTSDPSDLEMIVAYQE